MTHSEAEGADELRVQEIEQEIEQTRNAITDDIQALSVKLSPTRLTRKAKHYVEANAVPLSLILVSVGLNLASGTAPPSVRSGRAGRFAPNAFIKGAAFAIGFGVGMTAIHIVLRSDPTLAVD